MLRRDIGKTAQQKLQRVTNDLKCIRMPWAAAALAHCSGQDPYSDGTSGAVCVSPCFSGLLRFFRELNGPHFLPL